MPLIRLVAPGPTVASQTPTLPVARAWEIGHFCCSLLMPHQDMPDVVPAKDCIVNVGLFARQAEHRVHVESAKHLDNCLAAVHDPCALVWHGPPP